MIEASICPACDRMAVPPEDRCLACGSATEASGIEPRGTVLAKTRLGEDGDWIALVELEGGARVLAEMEEGTGVGGEVLVLAGPPWRVETFDEAAP